MEVSKNGQYDNWYIAPRVNQEWVNEKIEIYADGTIHYFMNGEDMGSHHFDLLTIEDAGFVNIDMSPYGWWYNHYHYMDDFLIKTQAMTISDDFNDGILDTNRNGIVSYDGGQFMLAAGRIVTEANGLIQDPNTGIWYFVSAGQVASGYRGLALYDGHWFYVWDGVFQDTAEGWVEYDGSVFYVVNGMVV